MADPVCVTVETELAATADHAFATIVPVDLPRIFARVGLLPAVNATREQSGPWDAAGRTRVVVMGDGSTARERLTADDAPHSFAYRVDGFTGPLARLVDHADGSWCFTPTAADRVHVRWTYSFAPRPRAALLVRLPLAWRRPPGGRATSGR